MTNSRSVLTAIVENPSMDCVDVQGSMFDRTTYKELLCSLLSISTRIRVDISLKVVILSRFAVAPCI